MRKNGETADAESLRCGGCAHDARKCGPVRGRTTDRDHRQCDADRGIGRKPGGIYVGETIIHRNEDSTAQIGVWEADVSETRLIDYPFTEYVMMISGRLVITNEDGSMNESGPGDTIVMPKGWTDNWDIQERMKKQHIKIGDPNAKPTAEPIKDCFQQPPELIEGPASPSALSYQPNKVLTYGCRRGSVFIFP